MMTRGRWLAASCAFAAAYVATTFGYLYEPDDPVTWLITMVAMITTSMGATFCAIRFLER